VGESVWSRRRLVRGRDGCRHDRDVLQDRRLCVVGHRRQRDDEGGLDKGSAWDLEIKRRIADCACFVPLVTRNTSSDSESYFWSEWNGAIDRTQRMDRAHRRFIFPVLADEGTAIPEIFATMQATRFSDPMDMTALADDLRREQQRFRKEQRA